MEASAVTEVSKSILMTPKLQLLLIRVGDTTPEVVGKVPLLHAAHTA